MKSYNKQRAKRFLHAIKLPVGLLGIVLLGLEVALSAMILAYPASVANIITLMGILFLTVSVIALGLVWQNPRKAMGIGSGDFEETRELSKLKRELAKLESIVAACQETALEQVRNEKSLEPDVKDQVIKSIEKISQRTDKQDTVYLELVSGKDERDTQFEPLGTPRIKSNMR